MCLFVFCFVLFYRLHSRVTDDLKAAAKNMPNSQSPLSNCGANFYGSCVQTI